MKLETFFEKFDQFANAPDAARKMRELVLQLAVQGRLVSQSPEDESAETLAATICEDRAAFVKERSLARQRIFDSVADDQCPFALPSGWVWTRLGNLCRVQAGFAFESAAFVQGDSGVPIIRIRDITKDRTQVNYVGEYREEYLVDAGDYLVGMDGNFMIAKWRGPCALLNQRVSRLQWYSQHLEPSFFATAAQYRLSELQGTKAYTTVDHLSSGQIEDAVVPLPPLAEQKRIVLKVDELMAFCDRLEAQQQERETRHTVLARASLARFADAPTPANLNFLFHKSYAIPPADLRKSILTLAVQGKLVSQDPRDAIVEMLLDAPIKAEGKNARWAGPIEEKEKPFHLPPSWTWFRLGEISSLKHGYAFRSEFFMSDSAPFVLTTPGNFYEKGGFRDRESKRKYYSGPVDPEFIFKPGDLIIPMTEQAAGLLGSPAFIPDDGRVYIHNQRLGKLSFSKLIVPEFAFWFFNCEFFREELARTCTGMKVRHTSPDKILRVPFPVCPLAEQRRIVAKVEQLMALVDELETQLAASRATAANLLSALVAELTGTNSGRKASAQPSSATGRRGRPPKSP